jgi:hypothetical protein
VMCYDVVSGERERRKHMIVDRSSLRWLAGFPTQFEVSGFGESLVFSKNHFENQGQGKGGVMRYKISQDFGGYNKL